MLNDKKTTSTSMKCAIMKFSMELLFKEMKLRLSQQSTNTVNQETKLLSQLRKKEPISHLLVLTSPIIRVCHLLKENFEEDASVVQAAAGLCSWMHGIYREGEIEKMLEERTASAAKAEDVIDKEKGLEKHSFFLILNLLSYYFFLFFDLILYFSCVLQFYISLFHTEHHSLLTASDVVSMIKLARGNIPHISTARYDDELVDICHRILSVVCNGKKKVRISKYLTFNWELVCFFFGSL
jgi:hypothetical protein